MKKIKMNVFLMIVIGFLLVPCVSTLGIDDDSEGAFTQDTDNDPPTFTGRFDSTSLVALSVDVLFYAIVQDIDNGSSELTLTLYYSNDSFVSYNESESMVFYQEISTDNYRYNYTMTGKPDDTYYQYYYQVNDGLTTVKDDNSGFYYDVQWSVLGHGVPGLGDTTSHMIIADTKESYFRVDPFMILVIAMILIMFAYGWKRWTIYQEG